MLIIGNKYQCRADERQKRGGYVPDAIFQFYIENGENNYRKPQYFKEEWMSAHF